jgi:methyl-accepting chemotaxis protein
MNHFGQKLKKGVHQVRKFGNKVQKETNSLGQKANFVLDKVDSGLQKIEKGVDMAGSIVSAANRAGLAQVPVVGNISSAAESGLKAASKGIDVAHQMSKDARKVSNGLEKLNYRDEAMKYAAKAPSLDSQFV